MTKPKAIGCAVVFGVLVILCLPTQLYGCMVPFLIVASVFALIAWRKHKRDKKIIAEAYQKQVTASQQMVLPPMTSKGSNGRLFVPPPLQ